MSTTSESAGLLRRLAHRFRFRQAYRQWNRERDDAIEDSLEYSPVRDSLQRLRDETPSWPLIGSPGRPVHVVLAPSEGPSFDDFRPGQGNIHFEIVQSLREMIGVDHVSVLDVRPGEPAAEWHARLLDLVVGTRATHLLFHAEADPASAGQSWSWDVPVAGLSRHWDGVFLGVMFDSAFEWILAKGRRLASISPRFVLVDICMPTDGVLVRGRPEVGPVNMPISQATVRLIEERIAAEPVSHDVSFIGALYPYRVELIDRLREAGITVAVNPHRDDDARDFEASRRNLPGYLDYIAGLRSSRMTINFSQSSAGPVQQLKTRVIESTLVGTLLLTDDVDRTSRFWVEGTEYVHFPNSEALPSIVAELLSDADRVGQIASAGQERSRALVSTSFWQGVDAGLWRRGLPGVLEHS